MSTFAATFINSLAIGSLYALIALGYTMVYGTLKFINFAHASVFMLGGWMSYIIYYRLHAFYGWEVTPTLAAFLILPAVILFCATLGLIVEQLAYKPLRGAPRLNVLITAIGVALFLENFSQLNWVLGASPVSMPSLLPDKNILSWTFADGTTINVRSIDALILLLACIFMMLLQYMIFSTRLGSAMRAVSQDSRTASLMGINVNRTIAITFLVGSALAGVAGFLYVAKYPAIQQPAHPAWMLLGLKAFVAAVVGGIGNVRGAMAGGLLIGFVEMFGASYFSPDLRDVYVFSLLILVLLFLPNGIFGKSVVEKV